MATAKGKPLAGQAVDASGGPVIDPTSNVKDLSEAANKRQDDLRAASEKYLEAIASHAREVGDLKAQHVREIGDIRDQHSKELGEKEASRLDATRKVDGLNADAKAANAATSMSALASTTTANAENLRKETANTFTSITDRLAAVERSMYEGKGKEAIADPQMGELMAVVKGLEKSTSESSGKQAVTDPQMAAMVAELRALTASNLASGGKSAGLQAGWAILAGVIGLAIGIGSVAVSLFK